MLRGRRSVCWRTSGPGGTSRGGLVWGINDFRRSLAGCPLRSTWWLAASAHLAIDCREKAVRIDHGEEPVGHSGRITAKVLSPAEKPWDTGLESTSGCTWTMVEPGLRDAGAFWERLNGMTPVEGQIPAGARRALDKLLPGKSVGQVQNSASCRWSGKRLGLPALCSHRRIQGRVCLPGSQGCGLCFWSWNRALNRPEFAIRRNSTSQSGRSIRLSRMQGSWIVQEGWHLDCARGGLWPPVESAKNRNCCHAMGWETAKFDFGLAPTAKLLRKSQ